MKERTDNYVFKSWEPLFGKYRNMTNFWAKRVPGTLGSAALGLRHDIVERFGDDGGFFMGYVCGDITIKQYIMKCSIQGFFDFNVDMLKLAIDIYEDFSKNTLLPGKLYVSGWNPDIPKQFKSWLFKLKYEFSQLNLKGIDSL